MTISNPSQVDMDCPNCARMREELVSVRKFYEALLEAARDKITLLKDGESE